MGALGFTSAHSSDERDSVILSMTHGTKYEGLARLSLRSYKLLVLGIEKSGKTSFFLQVLRRLHAIFELPFSIDLGAYVDIVLHTIVNEVLLLVNWTFTEEELTNPTEDDDPDLDVVRDALDIVRRAANQDFLVSLSADLRDAILDIYQIPRLYAFRAFSDVLPYYISSLDRICRCGADYVPSLTDILHAYDAHHLEKLQHNMKIYKTFLSITQTKGARRHRRFWFENLGDVFVVFYLVSLGDYDEVSEEDGQTNKLNESLMMFEQLCRFTHGTVPIFLIFTKFDVFGHKIQVNGLDYAFEEDAIPSGENPDLLGPAAVPPLNFSCEVYVDSEEAALDTRPKVVQRLHRSLEPSHDPVNPFEILPKELIVHILLFFDIVELSRVLSRVCFRLWRILSADDDVWRAMALRRYPLGEEACLELFNKSLYATWRQFMIHGAVKCVKRAKYIMSVFEEKLDQVDRHPRSSVFVVNTLEERQVRSVVSSIVELFEEEGKQ